MKSATLRTTLALTAVLASLVGCATPSGETAADRRASTLSMRDSALAELYRTQPGARSVIETSAGYAVFETIAMGVGVGGSNGYGVVEDRATGQRTFMRMSSGGLNLGVSAKEGKLILAFKDKATLDRFTRETFEWGSDAASGVKGTSSGGMNEAAGAATKSITAYQLTDTGFALTANLAGTKFWPDKSMN